MDNNEKKTDSRLFYISENEKKQVNELLKVYCMGNYYDDIVIATFDMCKDWDMFYNNDGSSDFVEYRNEELERETTEYNIGLADIVRFISDISDNDNVVLSTTNTSSKIILNKAAVNKVASLAFKQLLYNRWNVYKVEGIDIFCDIENCEDLLAYYEEGKLNKYIRHLHNFEKKQLENMIPLKYYIGYLLLNAVEYLKGKNIFDKSTTIASIKESSLLYDLLVLFEVIPREDRELIPKEKYDFVKNKIKSYQNYKAKKG